MAREAEKVLGWMRSGELVAAAEKAGGRLD